MEQSSTNKFSSCALGTMADCFACMKLEGKMCRSSPAFMPGGSISLSIKGLIYFMIARVVVLGMVWRRIDDNLCSF